MNQKGITPIFIVAGIVVVLIIISASYYLFRPAAMSSNVDNTLSPSPLILNERNIQWTEYKNNAFGFSFEYPSNYKKIEGSGSELVEIASPNIENVSHFPFEQNDNSLMLEVDFDHSPINDSYEVIKKELLKYNNNKALEDKELIEDAKVGTISAVHSTTNKSNKIPQESYLFVNYGKRIRIQKFPPNSKQKDIFEHFLASFKFFQPTEKIQSAPIILSGAWQNGTETYTNSKLDFTFQYPKGFIIANQDDPNKPFLVSFRTPDVPIEKRNKPGFDFNEYDGNTMAVSLSQYSNSDSLSLYDFIAKQNKSYPGDGKTETFDTYKKFLKGTNQPKEGSFVFEGNISENPNKEVYFASKDKVYIFSIQGGNNTGDKYSDEADKIFENIIRSVKFF